MIGHLSHFIAILFLASQTYAAPPASMVYENGSSEYQTPMFFDPLENGIKFKPMTFEYDMSKRFQLEIGPFVLNADNFYAQLGPLKSLAPEMAGHENADEVVLAVHWPKAFFQEGQLEVLSWTGEQLWKTAVEKYEKTTWQQQLLAWRGEATAKSAFFNSLTGVRNLSISDKWATEKGPFRFCLSKEAADARGRLCTGRYVFKQSSGSLRLIYQPEKVDPRVVVTGKSAPLQYRLEVPIGKTPHSFYAELENGISYEFSSIPQKPQILDMVRSDNDEYYLFMGIGLKPVYEEVQDLNPDDPTLFWNRIGWERTVGDLRKFWRVAVPKSDVIYVRGEGGGIFRQELTITKEPPRENMRLWLKKETPTSTVSWAPWIYGTRPRGIAVGSSEERVELERGTQNFDWRFAAHKKNEMNRSHVKLRTREKEEYRAHYEIYRGRAFDLSLRFSALVIPSTSGPKLAMMGEGAFSYWPDSLFGWGSYYLSRQRWGLSGKYYSSLQNGQIELSETSGTKDLSKFGMSSLDLKYRFTPGTWGRDETWGVMVGVADVNVFGNSALLAGPGFFWARSMPRIFDKYMSLFPLMDYPKIVDMELIYYAASLDPKVVPLANFAMNFHGKIFWSESIYGEAGFGLRYNQYTSNRVGDAGGNVSFGAPYGMVGMGASF